MKSGVLIKNIGVTLLGLCVMAVLGLVLMVVNSNQGLITSQTASVPSASTRQSMPAQLMDKASATDSNASASGASTDADDYAAGNLNAESAMPEVSIEQKKQVLSQFFEAADTDIARIKQEITNAKSLGDSAHNIQQKEQRLQQMLDLRQKMLVHNASLL